MIVETENIFGEPITGELVIERDNTCIVQEEGGERHVVRKEDLSEYGFSIQRTYYSLKKATEFYDYDAVKAAGRPKDLDYK